MDARAVTPAWRGWTLSSIVLPAACAILGAFVFTQPEAVLRLFGLHIDDSVDPEAFALVFRWLGVGPILLAVLLVALGARRARRHRDQGFRE